MTPMTTSQEQKQNKPDPACNAATVDNTISKIQSRECMQRREEWSLKAVTIFQRHSQASFEPYHNCRTSVQTSPPFPCTN